MGVSCKGANGAEFDNNWWWWRPLAAYCFKVAPEICEKSQHYARWNSNDGSMTNAEAAALAHILQAEIDGGRTKRYAQDYIRDLEKMPDVTCDVCHGTGKRSPLDGLQAQRESLKLIESLGDKEGITDDIKRMMRAEYIRACLQDPTPVECRSCDGYGKRRPSETMYLFSVENVQEFANFLRGGGFEVT